MVKNKKGLTFLEILATLLILSIAFIPMMNLMTGGIKRARDINNVTKCAFLAEGKMEEIRSQILGSNPSYGFSENYTISATTLDGNFKYTISDNVASDIKELNVTVWYDEDGDNTLDTGEVSVSLDTKTADRG